MRGCGIVSPEFGWSVRDMEMEDCTAESEYFMMRADHLRFKNVRMKGKYSFQYIEHSAFENCILTQRMPFLACQKRCGARQRRQGRVLGLVLRKCHF